MDVGRELKHGGSSSVSSVSAGELKTGIVSHESNMLMTWSGGFVCLLLPGCLYGKIDSLKTTCRETKNFLLVG